MEIYFSLAVLLMSFCAIHAHPGIGYHTHTYAKDNVRAMKDFGYFNKKLPVHYIGAEGYPEHTYEDTHLYDPSIAINGKRRPNMARYSRRGYGYPSNMEHHMKDPADSTVDIYYKNVDVKVQKPRLSDIFNRLTGYVLYKPNILLLLRLMTHH